jgi:DNA topoisomerase IB
MRSNDTALAVAVILCTYERVGNETSAKNGHYGVSNLLKDHIFFSSPDYIELRYVGKSGVNQVKPIHEPSVCELIHKRSKGNKKDRLFNTTPQQVNEYLSEFGITSKDIRTYAANKFIEDATRYVQCKSNADKARLYRNAATTVAGIIGNKPATLKSMYLHDSTKEKILGDKNGQAKGKQKQNDKNWSAEKSANNASHTVKKTIAKRR